jgi:hypothetical protein
MDRGVALATATMVASVSVEAEGGALAEVVHDAVRRQTIAAAETPAKEK